MNKYQFAFQSILLCAATALSTSCALNTSDSAVTASSSGAGTKVGTPQTYLTDVFWTDLNFNPFGNQRAVIQLRVCWESIHFLGQSSEVSYLNKKIGTPITISSQVSDKLEIASEVPILEGVYTRASILMNSSCSGTDSGTELRTQLGMRGPLELSNAHGTYSFPRAIGGSAKFMNENTIPNMTHSYNIANPELISGLSSVNSNEAFLELLNSAGWSLDF